MSKSIEQMVKDFDHKILGFCTPNFEESEAKFIESARILLAEIRRANSFELALRKICGPVPKELSGKWAALSRWRKDVAAEAIGFLDAAGENKK